eukprot:scaffold6577_cov175-Amphora_coffeaeformis.AAC.2
MCSIGLHGLAGLQEGGITNASTGTALVVSVKPNTADTKWRRCVAGTQLCHSPYLCVIRATTQLSVVIPKSSMASNTQFLSKPVGFCVFHGKCDNVIKRPRSRSHQQDGNGQFSCAWPMTI